MMSTQSMNQVNPASATVTSTVATATTVAPPATQSIGDKMMAKSLSPMSQAAAVFQSMMPPKSMYSSADAGPCDIYRSRSGIMTLKGVTDDSMMSAGGMYATKASLNAQTFGAPACGATKSSCGTISELMAKMKDSEIASMSPSDRNAINTFSALSIARLSKAKEQKDQMDAVAATSDAAASEESAPKVGAMMDELAKKSSDESSAIVANETVVKRDFLGRPCAPGTYNADMYRESYKKALSAGLDLSLNQAAPSLAPTPLFASLRDSSTMVKTSSGAAATSPAAGTVAPSTAAVAGVDANMARVDEALATDAAASTAAAAVVPAAGAVVATDNAGQTPFATLQNLSWPWIAGIVLLSLLAVLLIAGLIYWLVGGNDKPKGVVGRAVAAASKTIGSGVDAVKSAAKGILGAGEKALSSAAEGAVNAGESAFDAVKNTAGAALTAGSTALGTVGSTGGKLISGDLSGAGEELVEGVKDTANKTLDIAKTAGSGLVDTAGSVINSAGEVAGAAVDAGAAAVGGVADLAKGTVQGGVDVARAITDNDASSAESSQDESASASDASVGVDDINNAFAATEKAADATEELKARTEDIQNQAADILDNASDASADIQDAAEKVATALGDQR